MRNSIVALLFCLLIAGCGNQEESSVATPSTDAAGGSPEAAQDPRRFMAYEHSIALNVDEDQVEPIHKSIEAACLAAVSDQCVILSSHINVDREVSADIQLRAKPEGVKRMMANLVTQGKVVHQSVTAEDLATPIGDSARRLKMLEDYRSQLEMLRGKAAGDIESLIKVSKELAETQVQIEALSGEQAHLYHRVHTELLRISVSTRNGDTFWRPIGTALEDFKVNFGQGVSAVITALAYIIPWSVLLLAVWFGIRRIRSRGK